MNTIKNFLTNTHTWFTAATVIAGGVTAYEHVITPSGIVAGILTVVLYVCTLIINDTQVTAAGAPKV